MDKEAILKKIRKECKNIGEKCAPHLYDAGILGIDDLRSLGSEEAFFRMWQKNPNKVQIHAVYLYALEGAITSVNWATIAQKRKEELQDYAKKLRQSYS